MVPRQRVVLVFVLRDDGKLLLAPRARSAPVYAGRLSTVGGDVAQGESVESAARRALEVELGGAAELTGAGGLAVDFTDTVRRRAICFRVHPFLARARAEVALTLEGGVWLDPDDVIAATALGETLPELDEALARVLDPAGALPPPFRAEAHAVQSLRIPSRELARRAIAMVVGGAPPERVAALRPALARVVNAARAATAPARDVSAELAAAGRAEERALAAVVESVPQVVTIAAEAVLPHGDVVAEAGQGARAREAIARGQPVIAHADAWAAWNDDVPPPLTEDLELISRGMLTRIVGAPN